MPFPNENTQFKKGVSGNPYGRPKGSINLDQILNEMLEREIDAERLITDPSVRQMFGLQKATRFADVVTAVLLRDAAKGKEYAVKMLFERNSGKAPQNLKLSGDPENPIQTKVVVEFVSATHSEDTDTAGVSAAVPAETV